VVEVAVEVAEAVEVEEVKIGNLGKLLSINKYK
jgi:hypothetical protein